MISNIKKNSELLAITLKTMRIKLEMIINKDKKNKGLTFLPILS